MKNDDPLENDEAAKQFLRLIAETVSGSLGKVRAFKPLKPSVRPTDTGGYKTFVAATPKADIAIWVDKYARYPQRNIWYGYYWENGELFNDAVGHWREYFQKEFVRGDNDCTSWKPYHFKRRLDASDFGRPFLEKYNSTGEYFFGCFDLRTDFSVQLAQHITAFFRKTIEPGGMLAIENILERKAKVLEREEEQRLVSALRYARAHGVANEQKERDGYVCRICGFDFARHYPGIGSRFAEAHHRVPLSRAKGARVTVTPDSFVTLCANCHRMVHRAESFFEGDPIAHVSKAWKDGREI